MGRMMNFQILSINSGQATWLIWAAGPYIFSTIWGPRKYIRRGANNPQAKTPPAKLSAARRGPMI